MQIKKIIRYDIQVGRLHRSQSGHMHHVRLHNQYSCYLNVLFDIVTSFVSPSYCY